MSEHDPEQVELGAALRFFQCGSSLSVQGSREAIGRLGFALSACAEAAAESERKVTLCFSDPDGSEPGQLEVEIVTALTGAEPAGHSTRIPLFSAFGVLWTIVLPVAGLVALVLLLLQLLG